MISVACHKKPSLLSVNDIRALYGQTKLFCETSAGVINYVLVFCETMLKREATEIEFCPLPLFFK